ncbi:HlyD family efflux transporter periplasmic adaptor subunit [Catellatospora sp. NPDC049609]|uniref:efflux RND transporter periplasmic adaptor subunit n=1 Tax=Catellatospora sp. NPDC049609 TaxID=3155505 RepID=UPI00341E2530
MTFVVRGRRRRWLAAGAVVLAAAVAVAVSTVRGGDPAPAAAATTTVQRGEVTYSVAAAGKVAPVATRELAFTVAGTLTSVRVKPGAEVLPGQELAAIDDAAARAARDEAANALADAEQTLADARHAAGDDTSCEGVRAAVAGLRTPAAPVPTGSATAAPSGSPSPSASPGPSAGPSSSRTPGPGPSPSSPAAPGEGCQGGANSGGRGGTGADAIYTAQLAVNRAVAELARAERALAGTTLTAPVAAKVLSVEGRAGDEVGTATFITLGVTATMMVQAEFAEADAVSLAVGRPATVTFANRPEETLTATVAEVAATGTANGTLVRYRVLLAFDGSPEGLLIGQSATAGVVLNRAEGVLLLPQSAVRMTGDTAGEVKLPDGTARQVKVGLRGDGDVEIVAGLAEGDSVRVDARS